MFSGEQLFDASRGSGTCVEARTVDARIGRSRKALNVQGEKDPIRTVRSAGYALDDTFVNWDPGRVPPPCSKEEGAPIYNSDEFVPVYYGVSSNTVPYPPEPLKSWDVVP